MNGVERGRFWAGTPRAARWALAASVFLLVAVMLIPFAVLIVLASVSLHVSPMTAVSGPLPGNPLVMWLYLTLPATVLQAAVGLALRHSASGLRTAGRVGALAITTLALVWLGAIAYDGVRWILIGRTFGDFADLQFETFYGIPVLVVIAVLNARAALLSTRDLLGRQATPVAR